MLTQSDDEGIKPLKYITVELYCDLIFVSGTVFSSSPIKFLFKCVQNSLFILAIFKGNLKFEGEDPTSWW